jgi:hypothetical protein
MKEQAEGPGGLQTPLDNRPVDMETKLSIIYDSFYTYVQFKLIFVLSVTFCGFIF